MPVRPLVLIVEDEPSMLLLLRLTLDDAGFDTCLAADGATALRRIDGERPDAILLDLMLPVVDGWSVLAEVGAAGSPPVVICSATDSPRDRARAAEMGAVGFVAKPFDVDDLVHVLREVVADRWMSPADRGTEPGLEGILLDHPGLETA